MKKISSRLLSAVLMMILLTGSCGTEKKQTEDKAPPREVTTYRTETKQMQPVLEGFGNLSFRHKADITAAVDGTLKTILAEEGDSVKRETILAGLYNIQLTIRAEQADAALFSAESAYELAENRYREGRLQVESRLISLEKSNLNLKQKEAELEYQRTLLKNKKELHSLGGITEEELKSMKLAFSALETEVLVLKKDIQIQKIGFRDEDIESFGYPLSLSPGERRKIIIDINSLSLLSELKVAEARVKSAVTEYHSAEALLGEMVLRSPIDGIVGAKYMETGERVKSDSKVFTIFDSSEVDFVFSVPEEIGVLLTDGQDVSLSIDAVKDAHFTARIRLISPTIDPKSGNIIVKARLNNAEGEFKPGMFARFSLNYGKQAEVLLIPPEALARKDGGRGTVFKIRGRRVYPVNITLGNESGGYQEVTGGLLSGDTVVLNPSPMLQEGEEINVK
ncbi:MAG: efflux RND transporter periplasmic adaptor subunit [Spirochaetales bacterium]|nr:efflux RND transporter periplasmic adaptor subunit [Spirochaetales bacterium]